MTFQEQYERNKKLLLTDGKINLSNRKIFTEFFIRREKKLRRINDISKLDEPCYKTLIKYINMFRNVNNWFGNKSWKLLTTKEIRKVYDDLEDGIIKNSRGQRFGDRRGYYNKVFKSLPFELAGKKKEVDEALDLFTDKRRKEVNFVNEEGFKKIVSVVSKPEHLALLWLAWDIGENINTLLKLEKSNFQRIHNKETQEFEYRIWLPQNQLKRSRKPRSEYTLFPETTKYIDIILEGLDPKDKPFKFGYRQALKLFNNACNRAKVTCEPTGKKASWKDLRSGMAINLFSKGWSSDDINLRLGHNVTSKELEAYFSYAGTNGKKAKQLHYNNNLEDVRKEMQELKQRERYQQERMKILENAILQNMKGPYKLSEINQKFNEAIIVNS